MDSASEKSQDLQGDSEDSGDKEVMSNLTIWVDIYGEIRYNMDWEEGQDGVVALAKIFYEVLENGYGDMILSKMKEQCVLNDTELEFESFVKLINYHGSTSSKTKSPEEKELKNKPLISPDKSAYTI